MATKKQTKKKELDFYTWLRSGLRSLSRKWVPVYTCLANAKVPYNGDNKRRKFSYVCNYCKKEHEAKYVKVDHVEPAGRLATREDITPFIERLFCPVEGLQVLCSPCHDAKTLMEKNPGMTMEEAFIEKEIISICKKPVKDVLQFLESYGIVEGVSNAEKRRDAVSKILRSV